VSYHVAGARRFLPPRPLRRFIPRSRRAHYRTARLDGLGLSFKPPRFARKAVRSVGRVVRSGAAIAASSFIPGGGLLIGSRKAPRFLRAPKGVRPFVRTAAKVQLAAGAVIAAAVLAPAVLPALLPGAMKLLPFAAKFLPKSSTSSPGPSAPSADYGPGYGGGGDAGGGGTPMDSGGGAPASMDTPNEVNPEPAPAAAGGGALAIGALLLGGFLLARRSTRKA
jgi:hypothetical protein